MKGRSTISIKDLDILFEYMRKVLYDPSNAKLNYNSLQPDLKEFGEGLEFLGDSILEIREFANALSRGEMDAPPPPPENEIAAPLKALQASLKHISWQAKQVAQGDYEQKVHFMGEFSDAFNEMVAQLRDRQFALESEMELAKTQTQDLERSNSLFKVITGNMSEWIVMVDKKTGEHLFANHPIRSVVSSDIFEKQLYDILMEYAQNVEMSDDPKNEEFMLISDEGLQYFSGTLYPIKWYSHEAVACVLTDVTAEKEALSQLENVAYNDTQTGVYNRHYGMKVLNEWVDEKKQFRLIFADMDMLKYVNDEFGHNEGDVYIQSVADLLCEISMSAVVARLGGDEFMVLLKESDVRDRDMSATLEDLRDKLIRSSKKDENGEIMYNRSLSFGIVEVTPDNTLPASDILSMADERMYEYKKAHKKERVV